VPYTMIPVWYSSHCASIQGSMIPRQPHAIFQPHGRLKLEAMFPNSMWITSASQPWSKSWPKGEELPVRLACLPSMQSRLTYSTTDRAVMRYSQRGASPAKFGK